MAVRTELQPLVLNVPALARKTQEEVRRILGPPSQTASTSFSRHPRLTYQSGAIEIVFVDNRVDAIILRDTRGLPFDKQALAKLGLPVRKPTLKKAGRLLRWDNLIGVREVSLFFGTGRPVSHVLVVVGGTGQAAT